MKCMRVRENKITSCACTLGRKFDKIAWIHPPRVKMLLSCMLRLSMVVFTSCYDKISQHQASPQTYLDQDLAPRIPKAARKIHRSLSNCCNFQQKLGFLRCFLVTWFSGGHMMWIYYHRLSCVQEHLACSLLNKRGHLFHRLQAAMSSIELPESQFGSQKSKTARRTSNSLNLVPLHFIIMFIMFGHK
jgi:hypothetical protein